MPRPAVTLLILLAGLPLFFVNLGNDPSSPSSQLNSLAHFVFFALLAWALARLPRLARLSFARRAAAILLIVLVLGAVIEVIQPYFGRTRALADLGVNLLGASCGLLFLAPGRTDMPWAVLRSGQGLVLALCVMVFSGPVVNLWDMSRAARQFPVLSDFETRFEHTRWTRGRIHHGLARHGRACLRVPLNTQRYTGTTMRRSLGDWRGYSALGLSIYNPDPDPLQITVSIRDREHDKQGGAYKDRFNRIFTLNQGWTDLRIPVVEIAAAPADRTLDLSRLTAVAVFAVSLPEPRTIFLDHVRLIP